MEIERCGERVFLILRRKNVHFGRETIAEYRKSVPINKDCLDENPTMGFNGKFLPYLRNYTLASRKDWHCDPVLGWNPSVNPDPVTIDRFLEHFHILWLKKLILDMPGTFTTGFHNGQNCILLSELTFVKWRLKDIGCIELDGGVFRFEDKECYFDLTFLEWGLKMWLAILRIPRPSGSRTKAASRDIVYDE